MTVAGESAGGDEAQWSWQEGPVSILDEYFMLFHEAIPGDTRVALIARGTGRSFVADFRVSEETHGAAACDVLDEVRRDLDSFLPAINDLDPFSSAVSTHNPRLTVLGCAWMRPRRSPGRSLRTE
jgi:hypothetical protein